MLLRWLTSEFPRELRLGWRRLADDALAWCSVAAALTLLGYAELMIGAASQTIGENPSPGVRAVTLAAACARTAAPPLVFVLAAVRFKSRHLGEPTAWSSAAATALRRWLPALLAWLAASLAALLASLVAQFGVIAALTQFEGPPESVRTVSVACRVFVFVSLLARFAFVPFIVAIERRGSRASKPEGSVGAYATARRLAWPLPESWALTRNAAWRLVPYVFLVVYAPVAAGYVAPALRAPASFLMHLVSFTALAVIFGRYFDGSRDSV